MRNTIVFFFLFVAMKAHAEFQWAADIYSDIINSEIATTDLNPGNQILKLPIKEGELDLRADLKWTLKKHKIISRPRWVGFLRTSENYQTQKLTTESKGEVDLTDMFVESLWTRNFSTTIGLQVYQWGPAELLSPSNPLYHFNPSQRSLFYKEKGKVILRANYSFNKRENLILMVEPISNAEPEFQSEAAFSPKGLIKYELSWRQGSNYAGWVAGIESEKNPFIGEYIIYTPVEGFSVYADARQLQYQHHFVPAFNGITYDMVLADREKMKWSTLATAGFRYEDKFDARIEYIYNQSGYSKVQLQQAISSAANFFSPSYLTNLARFSRPGLELLGKQYIYFSLRITDPFKFREMNFYTRTIYSLQDASYQLQLEADKTFLENWTALLSGSRSFGDINSEFKLVNNWRMAAGIKRSY